MKNVFIGGVAKSGKSTLAERISKDKSYNHIPVDYIVSSLKRNFPEYSINSNVIIEKQNSIRICLILSRIISIIDSKDEKYILDSAHVYPKDIIKSLDSEKWDVYFVGHPNISIDEKLMLIKKYDTESDWTNKYSDVELSEKLSKLFDVSKQIEIECKTINVNFIDSDNIFKD